MQYEDKLRSNDVKKEASEAKAETHVLDQKEDTLPISRPRELVPHIVRYRDPCRCRIQEVATQAESSRRIRAHDLDNLRDLDDGSAEDDAEAEGSAERKMPCVSEGRKATFESGSLLALYARRAHDADLQLVRPS